MPPDTSTEQDPDDPEPEFAEVDPTGRYGRYKEVLGKGAFKKVYRAFDELEGIEVAWNQVKVAELLRNSEDLERLYSEVHLLKTLKHKNIIKFYNSWVDTKNEHINFITEIFTSGTLRQYRKKHKHVDLRALKKWSRQILEGLWYLHSNDPPIIHRDLKCDNIFVNGNHGEVKIGDLGLAAILHHANAAHSVIGTPEFMAPELYEEEYNELVDIYAFGMCLLELVTFEYPYIECSNAAQIYKKVTSGIKPASLAKVTNPDVKAFLEKCIANVSERLSARDLLNDPFLSSDQESTDRSLHINVPHAEVALSQSNTGKKGLENTHPGPSRDLSVHGERKDVDTIFIKLKIADSKGCCRNIHFPFDIEADTSIAVASEMVHELDLTDQDIPTIADMIDSEIRALIPDWSPRESSIAESVFSNSSDKDGMSPLHVSEHKDYNSPLAAASGCLFPDQLPSGRKFWSDSPRAGAGFSPIKSSPVSPSDVPSGTASDFAFDNRQLPEIPESSNLHEEKADEIAHECEPVRTGDTPSEDDDKRKEIICDLAQNGKCDNKHPEISRSNVMDETEDRSGLSRNTETEEVSAIAEKLEILLAEQQKELDDLKWKHELGVSDMLKDLPSETRLKVFNMCNRKIPDYKLHCLMNICSGHATDPSSYLLSSQVPNIVVNNGRCSGVSSERILTRSLSTLDVCMSPRTFHVMTKTGKHGVGGDGSCSRDRGSSLMRESKSDMGIAVILKDDSDES